MRPTFTPLSLRRALMILAVSCALIHHPRAAAFPSDEALQPLRETMSKTLSVQFVDLPLHRVLDYIQSESGLTIVVDRNALDEFLDSKISISDRAISVRDLLELSLRQVGLSEIDYDVRNGRVFVSTPAVIIAPYLHTEVYDVRSITRPIVNFRSHPQVGLWRINEWGDITGGGGATGSLFDDTGAEEEAMITADLSGIAEQRLVQLIRQSVRIGSHGGNWETRGVTVRIDSGLMVVVNTRPVHEAVAALLKKYQDASGKLVAINARFLLMRTDTLEKFLADDESRSLVFDVASRRAFEKLVTETGSGVRLLGAARTVCFNTQRVNVTAASEKLFLSDVNPIISTGSAAFDPQVSALVDDTVLSIEPTASFDDQHVSLLLTAQMSLGSSIRQSTPIEATGGGVIVSPHDSSIRSKEEAVRPRPVGGYADDAKISTSLELPDQDSVRFNTAARVPDGGAVLLSGLAPTFANFRAGDSEVVLIIQAKVLR